MPARAGDAPVTPSIIPCIALPAIRAIPPSVPSATMGPPTASTTAFIFVVKASRLFCKEEVSGGFSGLSKAPLSRFCTNLSFSSAVAYSWSCLAPSGPKSRKLDKSSLSLLFGPVKPSLSLAYTFAISLFLSGVLLEVTSTADSAF